MSQVKPWADFDTFLEDLRKRFVIERLASHECTDNPTKVNNSFWKWMIARGRYESYDARRKLGILDSSEHFGGRVFCFNRFGRTETRLPDGRIVFIGGEHEDYYDPDFYIYNDVVVVHGRPLPTMEAEPEAQEEWDADTYCDSNTEVASEPEWAEDLSKLLGESLTHAVSAEGARPDDIVIYRYPTDVFLGTDFHTATYYKDNASGKEYIYIIGGLGYVGSAHRSATLTYQLDLQDFSIQRMETSGEAPPPLIKIERGSHGKMRAELDDDRILYIGGGSCYQLSLADMRWTRL